MLLWSVWSLAAKPLVVPPGDALPVDLVNAIRAYADHRRHQERRQGRDSKSRWSRRSPRRSRSRIPTAKVVEKKEVKAARETAAGTGIQAGPRQNPSQRESRPRRSPIRSPTRWRRRRPRSRSRRRPRRRRRCRRGSPRRRRPSSIPGRWRRCSTSARPTRLAAAGDALKQRAFARRCRADSAAQMSLSELDALRARLGQLWNIPAGAKNPHELVVLVRVKLKPDGTLAAPPMVLTSGNNPAVHGRARQRHSRALSRPALRHAQARTLRAMERHRDHLRSARHGPRMIGGAPERPNHDRLRFDHDLAHAEPAPSAAAGQRRRGGRARGAFAAAGRQRCSSSTSPRATSSRCRSRSRISFAVGTRDPAAARNVTPDHRLQPAALRSVCADRSGRLSREDLEHRRAAALSRLAADQRAGAGHRPRHARPTAASRPSSGCGTCSRASSCTVSNTPPPPTTGAASPTSFPMRSTSGSPARRAISTAASSSSTRSGPKDRRDQAARAHGSGRRQCALSHARRRSRADAAVLAPPPTPSPTCRTARAIPGSI